MLTVREVLVTSMNKTNIDAGTAAAASNPAMTKINSRLFMMPNVVLSGALQR